MEKRLCREQSQKRNYIFFIIIIIQLTNYWSTSTFVFPLCKTILESFLWNVLQCNFFVVSKRRPSSTDINFGKKKSQDVRSGEQEGWCRK